MTNFPHSDEPLLTAADIWKRSEELRELERKIADFSARRDEVSEWLRKVSSLIGDEKLRGIVGYYPVRVVDRVSPSTRSGKLIFTDFIEDYVRERARGVDYKELREAAWGSPLKETMERTDKTFHSAIGKLVEQKRLIRHNHRLYTLSAYEEHLQRVKRGEVDGNPPAAPTYRSSPMAESIKRHVGRHPTGIKSRDIITFIGGMEEFAEVVGRNTTSVYNVISRLVQRGEIRKSGTTYFPPNGGNENSGSDEEAAA